MVNISKYIEKHDLLQKLLWCLILTKILRRSEAHMLHARFLDVSYKWWTKKYLFKLFFINGFNIFLFFGTKLELPCCLFLLMFFCTRRWQRVTSARFLVLRIVSCTCAKIVLMPGLGRPCSDVRPRCICQCLPPHKKLQNTLRLLWHMRNVKYS